MLSEEIKNTFTRQSSLKSVPSSRGSFKALSFMNNSNSKIDRGSYGNGTPKTSLFKKEVKFLSLEEMQPVTPKTGRSSQFSPKSGFLGQSTLGEGLENLTELLKTMSLFNIPKDIFNQNMEYTDRYKYVIGFMERNIKENIKHIDQLSKQRKNNWSNSLEEIKKMKHDIEKKRQIYNWLKYNTEFDALGRKVKQELIKKVEKQANTQINKGEINKDNILKKFLEGEINIKSPREADRERHQILTQPMGESFNKFIKKYHNEIDKQSMDEMSPTYYTNSLPVSPKMRITPIVVKDPIIKKRPNTAKACTISPKHKPFFQNSDEKSEKKIEWNQNLESAFKFHREDARSRLFKIKSHSSFWDSVSIAAFNKSSYKAEERSDYIKLLKDSDKMNEAQLQELLLKFPSFIECLDKELIQKDIDALPIEKLQKVEANVSDKILSKYKREKKKIIDTRKKYLRKKHDRVLEGIKKSDEIFEKSKTLRQRSEENVKMKKKVEFVLKKLEEGAISLKKDVRSRTYQLYASKFDKALQNNKKRLLLQRKDDNPDKHQIIQKTHFSLGKGAENILYKYKSPDEEKTKRMYTGGPLSSQKNRSEVTKSDLLKAALMIQRAFKVFKAKKKLLHLKKERLHQAETERRRKIQLEKEIKLYRATPRGNDAPKEESPKNKKISNKKNDGDVVYEFKKYNFRPKSAKTLIYAQSVSNEIVNEECYTQNKAYNQYTDSLFNKKKFIKSLNLTIKQQNILDASKKNNWTYIEKNLAKLTEVDLNIKDGKGNTPLYYAVEGDHYETIEILLRSGANVNITNEHGNTALHKAFMRGEKKVISLLLNNSADLQIFNKFSQTPVYFASQALMELFGLKDFVVNRVNATEIKKGDTTIIITPPTNTHF